LTTVVGFRFAHNSHRGAGFAPFEAVAIGQDGSLWRNRHGAGQKLLGHQLVVNDCRRRSLRHDHEALLGLAGLQQSEDLGRAGACGHLVFAGSYGIVRTEQLGEAEEAGPRADRAGLLQLPCSAGQAGPLRDGDHDRLVRRPGPTPIARDVEKGAASAEHDEQQEDEQRPSSRFALSS
jgi:hypothetical protein